VTVVLFDRVNTSLADQRQARDQIVKVLGQIRREDRVALYAIYPVDARGLVVNQMPSVMTSSSTFGNTVDLLRHRPISGPFFTELDNRRLRIRQ
jgi:hypothetical protein